jgi:hypothetical protein
MTASLIIVALAVLGVTAFALLKRDWWLRGPFRRKAAPYKFERVEDLPDITQPLTLYLAGSEKNLWAAAMLCPCGCKERIELNLLTAARPCWTVKTDEDGTATLSPSVWRQKGCGSHFFLRNGLIQWC